MSEQSERMEITSTALLAKLRVYKDALKEIGSKRLYDGWIDRADKYQSGYADARRRDVKTAKDALSNNNMRSGE